MTTPKKTPKSTNQRRRRGHGSLNRVGSALCDKCGRQLNETEIEAGLHICEDGCEDPSYEDGLAPWGDQ